MNEHFLHHGFTIDGILHLSPKQAYECCLTGAIILDVREDYEVAIKDFGIKEKLLCPFTDFEKQCITLPRDKPLIVADCVGIHSHDTARILIGKGFTMTANMAGGIVDWERDGLPMKTDIESMNGPCACQIKSRPA